MKPLFGLMLAASLAACKSLERPADAGPDWEPLAAATSPCGRYVLRLEHAEWRTEPGKPPLLSLQMALRGGGPDVLLGGRPRVTDLVPPDGAEFHEGDLKGYGGVDSHGENLFFHGLEVYHRTDGLRRLRIECRILRVLSWRTFDLSCASPDDSREFLCPPYHVQVIGDAAFCSVSAACTDDWRTFPSVERDLFGILGHDWVAGSAVLEDATGRRLETFGASGSGGSSVFHYGSLNQIDPGAEGPPAVAYPVTGTLRLPGRYVVEVVPFEFIDCPLVRTDEASSVAASPDTVGEDEAMQRVLFRLSDEDLFARGITSVDQPGRKDWAVAWTEDRGPKFDAVDRVLREAGIAGGAHCDLGRAGWYVQREDFFRARRTLLADRDVVRLGVTVVTPRVEGPTSKPWQRGHHGHAGDLWEQ